MEYKEEPEHDDTGLEYAGWLFYNCRNLIIVSVRVLPALFEAEQRLTDTERGKGYHGN